MKDSLATRGDILAEVDKAVGGLGLIGERRAARLIYLAVTSRLLPRIVSVAVKGPSSSGKSELVKTVLRLFPPGEFVELTSMSERALIYNVEEPLKHRMVVIYEWSGLASDYASYLVRTLMSEGRIRYKVTEKGADGKFAARTIEVEGPTGFMVTTTAASLHAENETRILSIPVSDSVEQTRAVLLAQARGAQGKAKAQVDLKAWHALQRGLSAKDLKECPVVVPFATKLAELIPVVALRLRRDFPTVLALIEAHALLHQATRERDESDGAVVATVADYAAVRELVGELVSEGVDGTVPKSVRETVEAVKKLTEEVGEAPNVTQLAARLGIHKSSVSRRVAAAVAGGWLVDASGGRAGVEARLVAAAAVPNGTEVLPQAEVLAEAAEGGVAVLQGR